MPLFACLSLLSFFGMTATQLTSSMDRFWLWIVLTCDNWTCSTTIWALHWSRDFTYYLKLAILIHCQSLDPALKCLLITMASELDSLCSKCFFAEYPVLGRTWKNWVANAFCFDQGLLRYRDYKLFKRRSIPRAFGVPCKWRWKIPTYYSKKSSIMYFVWSSAIQWLQSMLVLRWKNEDWQKAS